MNPKLASAKLKVGEIYSRKSLREIFPTSDATLNTGVFRPKNYFSVWLFVTRKKAPNQPKYVDYLSGQTLHWQGQTSGKSDQMIIEHRNRDLELLLFYREEPKQYANSGFRYVGPVEYMSHNPGHPSSFKLRLTTRPK